MSKKKRGKQDQVLTSGRKQKAIAAFTLPVILALAGGIHQQLSSKPLTSATNMPMALQSTPTPTLAKEYIYADDRLLATIEPLEGDVHEPEKRDAVTIADWVKVGRFAAGLDTPTTGSEFQRADCAPRSTRGNNAITISDWVQSGRYAVGLDPPTVAWGPTGVASSGFAASSGVFFAMTVPSGLAFQLLPTSFSAKRSPIGSLSRTVRIVSPNFVGGQNGTVLVELDSLGDENGMGLSLTFNTSQLTFVSAVKGSDATNATLNVNASSASSGRVGLGLAQPSNQTFAAGTRQAVVVTFAASSSGTLLVSSGDRPVLREVVDVNANTLATTFTP